MFIETLTCINMYVETLICPLREGGSLGDEASDSMEVFIELRCALFRIPT